MKELSRKTQPSDEGNRSHSDIPLENGQENNTRHTTTGDDTAGLNEPPNGGYGWVCAAAVSVLNAHSWGFNSAYAVFLAHYLRNDVFAGATPLQYAFVGSLSLTSLLLVSPVATVMVREIGIQPTMFCGALLEALSLIFASLSSKIWHLFLAQGVLFGLGLGLLFIPSTAVIPQWFTTRRSLASGVALSGGGWGGLLYSFAAEAMIQNLGLKYAFRILGIVSFVANTICTLIIKDRNKITGAQQRAFDLSLFKRWEYVLLVGFSGFSILGYFILVFSLANYANVIGLNASQAATISALLNGGQAIGRPLIGYFSDSMGRMNVAGSMTFIAGVLSLVVWVNARSYGVLIFFAITEGLVAGTFWATIAPLMAEVVGIKRVTSGLNLIWLSMVLPSTFSEPIALGIFEGTGSYLGAQLFTGLVYIAAAVCMGLLRGWKIGDNISEWSDTPRGSVDEASTRGNFWHRCLRLTKV
ncbi:monocarboxylate transporter [Xylariaceae sp. AK1471]|nr:monocarboxylate transporter [Xylariaceae sp. AK1471]